MVDSFSWIKRTLDGQFGKVNWQKGLDLDRDGQVSRKERIRDYNHNGQVGDPKDWEHFLGSNAKALQRRVAFFRWAAPLKADNPIHDCLSIESELASPQEVKETYAFVQDVLKRVRSRLNDGVKRSNQEKLKLVYDVMRELGIRFAKPKSDLLTANVKEKVLDCDTSSFVVKAIAREMGWPVYLVEVPDHVFVRWEKTGGERFNMDFGHVVKDEYYVKKFRISQVSIDTGVYLSSQTSQELRAQFFQNRGISKAKLGRREEAIRDFDEAIRLDPKNASAYHSRGISKTEIGRYEETIRDYDEAIRLDPNDATSYYNRGVSKAKLGRREEAIRDFDEAIRLDPKLK